MARTPHSDQEAEDNFTQNDVSTRAVSGMQDRENAFAPNGKSGPYSGNQEYEEGYSLGTGYPSSGSTGRNRRK